MRPSGCDMQTTTLQQTSITQLEQGFYLGDWLVLPQRHCLQHTDSDRQIHLEPKAIQVLQQLAHYNGEFLSREQLLKSVWNTRFVSEDVLTGAVAAIRKALGDDSKNPRFIETRRGVGYRLIVSAKPNKPARSRHQWVNRSIQLLSCLWQPSHRFATVIATAILVLSTAWVVLQPAAKNTQAQSIQASVSTIAVLPFIDYSRNDDNRYFADAVTEALIQKLAELQYFRVISRTSVMPYRSTQKTAREIADELGVDWFLEGSILHEHGQVRITAQLIDAKQDQHLWSGHFDRPFTDIFALLNEVVTAISMPVLNTAAIVQPAMIRTLADTRSDYPLPPDHLDNYLMARYLMSHETPDSAFSALQQFNRLSEQQPEFFGAHLGKAQALLLLFKHSQLDSTALDTALLAVQRALELKPSAADAYRCRGQIVFFRDMDFLQAESDYQMSIAMNASDHVARRRYAWLLVAQQRFSEAQEQLNEIKRLDPVYYADAANALLMLYTGDAHAAITDLKHLKHSSPDSLDIHTVLWRAYLAANQVSLANQTLLELLRLQGLSEAQQAGLQEYVDSNTSQAFYTSILEQNLLNSPLHQAMLQLRLDQTDTALELVEQAWRQRNPAITYLSVMPNLQALHQQPRFQTLLNQLETTTKQQRLSVLR